MCRHGISCESTGLEIRGSTVWCLWKKVGALGGAAIGVATLVIGSVGPPFDGFHPYQLEISPLVINSKSMIIMYIYIYVNIYIYTYVKPVDHNQTLKQTGKKRKHQTK